MLIADQRSEDTLFFRNAAFMDSILNSTTASVFLKSLMHLLLAKRINEFKERFNYRRNKNLIRTGNPSMEYGQMTDKDLDSLIADHMEKAIDISKQLNRTNPEELLWVSSDPLIFLFKPVYTDLLYGERICMIHTRSGGFSDKNASAWLSQSQDWFIKNGDQIKSFTSYEQMLFRYFREWIVFNLPNRAEAAYFTETLARKYIHEKLNEDSTNKAAYEKYLLDLLPSPLIIQLPSGHAAYQLCKIWYADASNYNQTVGSLLDRYRYAKTNPAFDSSYRLYYNKALTLLNRFENRLDSFSYIKNDLLGLRAEMLRRGLTVKIPNVQTPGAAFPVMLQYRNIGHLYTRIVRFGQLDTIANNKSQTVSRFMSLPALTEKTQTLILPDDHQWHNAFLKWDPLPTGRYIILYSDTPYFKRCS